MLPWVSPEIRLLMKQRVFQLKRAKRAKQTEDWECYKKLRNTVTKEMRKAKLQFFERVSGDARSNPSKAWRELGRLLGGGQRLVTELKTPETV